VPALFLELRPGADASLASAARLHAQNGFRRDWIPAFAGTSGVNWFCLGLFFGGDTKKHKRGKTEEIRSSKISC
jgi:hypothetical protein